MYNNLLIFDGSNLIHRQLSQPNMWELEYNGVKTGGVFGFMRSVLSTMNKFPKYYPVVVFDYGRSPRRLEIYPNYKHNQDQVEERQEKKRLLECGQITFEESQDEYLNELIRQSNIIKDLLRMFNIPVIQVSKWEGDDIMAILSRIAKDSVVVTDDKDMYQLMTPTCRIYRAMRLNADGSKGEIVTFEDNKHPVYNDVRHLVLIKAVVGDGSDNIPHVAKGIGYKTAEKIVDIILENNEDPDKYLPIMIEKGRKFKVFADNHDIYIRNLKLVDLSIVDQDPYVLEIINKEINNVLNSRMVNMIDIMKVLASNGIVNFDFNKLIQLTNMSKPYLGDTQNG